MASSFARQEAARAWQNPSTCDKVMDPELAEAFAEIIDGLTTKPWLGNATTGELIDEIRARIEVDGKIDYKVAKPGNV